MKATVKPIIVEETYSCSTQEVWQTITQLDQMHQWYFNNIPDFKAEVGFETQFLVQSGDKQFKHL